MSRMKKVSKLNISSSIKEQIKMVTILKERNLISSNLLKLSTLMMLRSKKKDSQMIISLASSLERLKSRKTENTLSTQNQMMDQDFGSTERKLLKIGDSMEQEKRVELLSLKLDGTISKPHISRMVVVHQWLFHGKDQILKIKKNFLMDHMKDQNR
jgi:hypothetical protein